MVLEKNAVVPAAVQDTIPDTLLEPTRVDTRIRTTSEKRVLAVLGLEGLPAGAVVGAAIPNATDVQGMVFSRNTARFSRKPLHLQRIAPMKPGCIKIFFCAFFAENGTIFSVITFSRRWFRIPGTLAGRIPCGLRALRHFEWVRRYDCLVERSASRGDLWTKGISCSRWHWA